MAQVICVYIGMWIHVYVYILHAYRSIYIHIYKTGEGSNAENFCIHRCVWTYIHLYIYIYIYMERKKFLHT